MGSKRSKTQKRSNKRKQKTKSVKRGGASVNRPVTRPIRTINPKCVTPLPREKLLRDIMKRVKAKESQKVAELYKKNILEDINKRNKELTKYIKDSMTENRRKKDLLAKRQPGGGPGDSPGGRLLKLLGETESARNEKLLNNLLTPRITVEPFLGDIEGVPLPIILDDGEVDLESNSYGKSRTADINELPSDIKNLLLSFERKSK